MVLLFMLFSINLFVDFEGICEVSICWRGYLTVLLNNNPRLSVVAIGSYPCLFSIKETFP
jgi:hypothetical protein